MHVILLVIAAIPYIIAWMLLNSLATGTALSGRFAPHDRLEGCQEPISDSAMRTDTLLLYACCESHTYGKGIER